MVHSPAVGAKLTPTPLATNASQDGGPPHGFAASAYTLNSGNDAVMSWSTSSSLKSPLESAASTVSTRFSAAPRLTVEPFVGETAMIAGATGLSITNSTVLDARTSGSPNPSTMMSKVT